MAESNYPNLNTDVDTSLQDLDFDNIRHERFERNRHFLEGVNAQIASKVFPGHEHKGSHGNVRDQAAIIVQKYWRGYMGRQLYVTALWNKFEQEEEKQKERIQYQMEEGELLVENHQLEVLLDDGRTTRRNANRRYLSKVITIQRAWRSYLDRQKSKRTRTDYSNHGNVKQEILADPERNVTKRSNPFDNTFNTIADNGHQNKLDNNSNNDHIIERFDTACMINPLSTESQIIPAIDNFVTDQEVVNSGTSSVTVDSNHLSPRQQRKHSLLSQAKQFVELKKLDANVLPFNLHMHLDPSEGSESLKSRFELSDSMSEVMSPTSTNPDLGFGRKQCWGEESDSCENSLETSKPCVGINPKGGNSGMDLNSKGSNSINCDKTSSSESQKTSCDNGTNSAKSNHSVTSSNTFEGSNSGSVDSKTFKGSNSSSVDSKNSNSDTEQEDAFDVYNIETTLPDMDWNSLEAKLKAASEEAQKIQEARRNDREEIRKKLAMGAEDDGIDDDDDDEETTYTKPNIQTRLHSGLQICFMNESPGDTDNEGMSPRQHELHDNAKLLKKVSNLVDSDNNLSTVTDLNNPSPPTTSVQCSSPPRLKADGEEKAEDFHSRQEQLQNEAKMALAQAGSMAHMQLEIEKQTKKKSPMAEMVGIPGLGERHRKKLSIRQLQQMNLASIQVLYNDLQTQIENLNEELVHLLMERDELHMEQDSMLVDIEDLTRRAEELAERANRTGGNKGSKTSSKAKGKLPAR